MVKETFVLKDYIKKNILLSRSFILKIEEEARIVNEYVVKKTGVDNINYLDRSTWKYYLNLSGEYHESDTMMRVISADTYEEIDFTKQNLNTHTATRISYLNNSKFYISLLQKYPEQAALIRGIIYPCNLQNALTAENFSILSYNKDLVENNELTLITDLEIWIKNYSSRWFIRAFNNTNDLYITSFIYILYSDILKKLLNLRLDRCKTLEAHSFHVFEYLSSHQRLDKYIPYLTDKQKFWLYRNIRYIERNSGKKNQFFNLIEHIFTERKLPVSEYSLRHLSEFTDELKPELRVKRKYLNVGVNNVQVDYIDIEDAYLKETPIAYNNDIYFQERKETITTNIRQSNSSVLQTKDLENSILSLNDSVSVTLRDVIISLFSYCANLGLKTGTVTYKNIKNDSIEILNNKDAYTYMQYLLFKSVGMELTDNLPMLAIRVPITPKPSLEDLLSVTDKSYFINNKFNYSKYPDLVEAATILLNNQPTIVITNNSSDFFKMCVDFYTHSLHQQLFIAHTEDLYFNGYVTNMVNKLYKDVRIDIDLEGKSTSEWLKSRNIMDINFTYDEALLQFSELFSSATGLVVKENELMVNIQKALVNLFLQLSSYTIQFITEINSNRIVPVSFDQIRIGNIRQKEISKYQVTISNNVIYYNGIEKEKINLNINRSSGCRTLVHTKPNNINLHIFNVNTLFQPSGTGKCVSVILTTPFINAIKIN